MALGADDVEAGKADHLVVLGVGQTLEVLKDPLVVALGDAVEGVEMEEIGELFVLDEAFFALRQAFGFLLGQALLPRHEFGIPAEENVGAAAGHVGRDGHRGSPARLRDDFRFLRVVLRVQDDVFVEVAAGGGAALQAPPIEHRRQLLGLLDRHGADEDRAALRVLVDDLGDERVPFLALGPVNEVGILDAGQRAVGRNNDDVEVVDLGELFRLGIGGAGHARELLVFAEVVLEGHGRERLVFALDLDFRMP